ncbi:MEKHLA domain-containing protein [Lyngbya aestuarii]|uniref:MEKHLA domain-containing protein n=1 Tax=Lyngbya aestuarii TaxID=118322 RepID=UPI00403E29E6
MTTKGYLSNGQGTRVSSSVKKYMISDFTIWNLLDNNNQHCVQIILNLQQHKNWRLSKNLPNLQPSKLQTCRIYRNYLVS